LLSTILITSFGLNTYCQSTCTGVESYWSKYQAPLKLTFNGNFKKILNAPTYSGNEKGKNLSDHIYSTCGEFLGANFSFPSFGVQDAVSTDLYINASGSHGGEVSIAVDPNDKNILWECNMHFINSTLPYYVRCSRSIDRGISWSNASSPSNIANNDPTGIIHRNGSCYLCFLQHNSLDNLCDGKIHQAVYDGINGWQETLSIQEPVTEGYKFDKPFLAIDNTVENGIFYCVWSPRDCYGNIPPEYNNLAIEIVRSLDNGSSWEEKHVISTDLYPGEALTSNNGANIQIGPNSEVYVVWVCMDMTEQETDGDEIDINESGLVFVRSLDQGETYEGDGDKGYLILLW